MTDQDSPIRVMALHALAYCELLILGMCDRCMTTVRALDVQNRWPPDPPGFAII